MTWKQVRAVLHDYRWAAWYICVLLTILVVLQGIQTMRGH